jgi:hypothetical protein
MRGRKPFNRSHREIWVRIGRESRPMFSPALTGANLPSGRARRARAS